MCKCKLDFYADYAERFGFADGVYPTEGGLRYFADRAEERQRLQPPLEHWWCYLDVSAQLPELPAQEPSPAEVPA